jgi:hypothetical protein
MSKPMLGMLVGGALGLLDGLSAWASPEARPMIQAIVTGSTIKGLVTGLLAGFIARRWHSTVLGISAGLAIGFGLSSLAAIGQGDHYAEIVVPGMLLGAIVGFVTQRYPHAASLRTGVMVALALVLTGGAATAQTPAEAPVPDPLAPLAGLVGTWVGTSEGQPGKGTVERHYERVWNARYIRVRNRSVYRPQEKNPKGETHEDEGWFSFDRGRKLIVFRQFHLEGFVNQYVGNIASTPKTIVFVTEAIENLPSGWRARETYVLLGPDEFEEVFELAEAGQQFEVYSRSRFKRAR